MPPIQNYFKMKNIFGGSQDESPMSPSYKKPIQTPNFFGDDDAKPKSPMRALAEVEDEEENAGPINQEEPDEMSALDQFRESVLNPPKRQNPGIMRALGTGALSALQGSEKDRKPVYNAAGKVIGSKQMSGWERLGNDPFDVEQAGEILNMPNVQRMADYKLKTGGLKEAATLENNEALARYRDAQASNIPTKERRLGVEGEAKVENEQARIKVLQDKQAKNTLTDKEKIELEGRIKTQQIEQQGKNQISGIEATGKNQAANIADQGTNALNVQDARNKGTVDLEGVRHTGDMAEIGARGKTSIATKETVPGKNLASVTDKPESATQSKVRLQLRMNEYLHDHPEHAEFMNINEDNGMVDITPPTKGWFGSQSGPDQETYDAMVNHMKGKATTDKTPSPVQDKTDKKVPPVIKSDNKGKNKGSVVEPPNSGAPKKIVQRSKSTNKTRTSIDGGKTWTYSG